MKDVLFTIVLSLFGIVIVGIMGYGIMNSDLVSLALQDKNPSSEAIEAPQGIGSKGQSTTGADIVPFMVNTRGPGFTTASLLPEVVVIPISDAENSDALDQSPPETGIISDTNELSSDDIPFVFPLASRRIRADRSVILSVPYWHQDQARDLIARHPESIDGISLWWYYLGNDGHIQKYDFAVEDRALLDFARNSNMKVFARITNLPDESGSTWDGDLVTTAVNHPMTRGERIREILALVDTHNFDGVTIGFQDMNEEQIEIFTPFIIDLSQALRAKDKLLRVRVHPREDISQDTRAQDWKNIGRVVDHLDIMTYYEHWATGEAGPLASTRWITDIVNVAVALEVPREKVTIGIGFFGYDWPQFPSGSYDVARDVSFEEAMTLSETREVPIEFDSQANSPFMRYREDNIRHIVWFENDRSVEAKVNLAKQLGVGGITVVGIGSEDPAAWEQLNAF